MKPQDLVIIFKILIFGKEKWRTTDLSHELFLSQSEVSKGLKRLEKSKLYSSETRAIAKRSLFDLLVFGVPFIFPAEIGKLSKGVATSISCDSLKDDIISDDKYVWPHIDGDIRGESVTPLYPSVANAALKDSKLHELLALVDVLRMGRVREVALAKAKLKKRILGRE